MGMSNTVPCVRQWRKEADAEEALWRPCGWMIGGVHLCCGKNKRNLRICKETISWQKLNKLRAYCRFSAAFW